jgi:hypothetical protein
MRKNFKKMRGGLMTNTFDLVDLFKNFLEYLKTSNVKLREDHINMDVLSLSDRLLKRKIPLLAEKWNILMKDEDLEVFNLSGLSICWTYTNKENQFIYGSFLLNGFTEALIFASDFWEIYNSLNTHKPDNNELEFLEKLNWFEKQSSGDDGKYGCFLREPGEFPPKIYFYDRGAYFPMAISFDQYLDAMIASCAVRGWQYFYIDIPDDFPDFDEVNKSVVLKDLEFIIEMLPKLFPDKDFSYHIKRMDYIRERLGK